jgi:predicted RNA-binding protein associated with RNAse of E/G family
MITVIKLDPQGQEQLRYHGEIIEQHQHGVVIQATWDRQSYDLGYTRFETGDRFTEYYYTDRWYNIFEIATADGVRKGWYCNIAEPARIENDTIKQVDLFLDVWVDPDGQPLLLDEDEFAAVTTLSEEQRDKARQGLQAILQMLEAREEVFAGLVRSGGHGNRQR